MEYLKSFVFLFGFLFTVASARDLPKAKTSNIDAKTIANPIGNGGGLPGVRPYFGGFTDLPGSATGEFPGIYGSGYPGGVGSRGLFPGVGSEPYFGRFPRTGNEGFPGIDGSGYPGGGGGWSGRQYFRGFPNFGRGIGSGGLPDIDGSGYLGRRGGLFPGGGGYLIPGLW